MGNHLGIPGQDAYRLDNVIAAAGIAVNSSRITLNDPAFRFTAHSLNRHAFLVSRATAVIRYECDFGTRTLRRYGSRPIPGGGIAAFPAGTPSRLIARDVTACTFTPRPSTAEHGGILLLQVTISRVTNGAAESLRVMQQLRVEEVA